MNATIEGVTPEQLKAIRITIGDETLTLTDLIDERAGLVALVDKLTSLIYCGMSLEDWQAIGYTEGDYRRFLEDYEARHGDE